MNPHDSLDAFSPNVPSRQAPDNAIPQLVSQVYECAPSAERRRLLEHLIQPLGLLSLVTVANGVFAKIWFRRGWQDLHIRIEDTEMVRASDVVALVDHVQQVCIDTVDGLVRIVSMSPAVAGTAAAALLVAALVRRSRSQRVSAGRIDDPAVS